MKKPKIVAGNWKMNLKADDAVQLAEAVAQHVEKNVEHTEVIFFAPTLYLGLLAEVGQQAHIALGAQNCYAGDFGAFTGEINPPMLASASVRYCLVGHSERRTLFNESDEDCLEKCKALLEEGLTPVLCVGESLAAREKGDPFEVVEKQLSKVFSGLSKEEIRSLVLAYEPVWAIGTGKTATPEQAEEMHAFMRSFVRSFIPESAGETIILYGGSCNEKNADELFSCENVDGGLIGGASLKIDSFCSIIDAAEALSQ